MDNYQIIESTVSAITFLFFFGYFRQMILGEQINSLNIIFTTLLFFFWYSFTLYITNIITKK